MKSGFVYYSMIFNVTYSSWCTCATNLRWYLITKIEAKQTKIDGALILCISPLVVHRLAMTPITIRRAYQHQIMCAG